MQPVENFDRLLFAVCTANTDPAAAARRQQYQTEITAALRAGDYQHALKLFNEFGNPNLRALNEVQTLKAFTEFANAAGYSISPAATEEFTGNNPVKNWSQETDSTNAAEKSTEDESIRKFRNDIKEGKVSLRISPQKQARHIWGSKEHNAYRERLSNRGDFPSYIREDLTLADLTEIVKKKAGDGSIGQKTDMSFKEYVDCDEIIGYYYSKEEGKYVPTSASVIFPLRKSSIYSTGTLQSSSISAA